MVAAIVQLLLTEYNRYEPFIGSCHRIKPDLTPGFDPFGVPLSDEHERIQTLVQDLARRWNLDRVPGVSDNRFAEFRDAVRKMNLERDGDPKGPFWPLGIGRADYEFPVLTIRLNSCAWDWDATFVESFREFRHRIMRDVGVKRPGNLHMDLQSQLGNLRHDAMEAGIELSDRPTALVHHVRWLFRRLCPQPDHVWGWKQIAEEERDRSDGIVAADRKTIKRNVIQIARDVGIELPVLPRGRPRVV